MFKYQQICILLYEINFHSYKLDRQWKIYENREINRTLKINFFDWKSRNSTPENIFIVRNVK